MLKKILTFIVLASLSLTAACSSNSDAQAAKSTSNWYRGNLHTHSLWSDGDDFPEMIAQFYRDSDYDFLALSDHNTLSEGERWMPLREVRKRSGELALDKYKKRFPEAVKIRTGADGEEVLLSPLPKIKELVEKPGEFLMIQSEEISAKFEKKPIHINATNIGEAIKPQTGASVVEVIRNNLRAITEQSQRLNRPIVAHLNHPNFVWGVSAEELAHAVEEKFFEVYNGHPKVNQLGDETRPSIDRLWDICNTIRLAQLNAEPLRGLATDDAHHYHGPGMNRATALRGWTMVRASALDTGSIVAALQAGDFYASSGVTLKDVRYDERTKTLHIKIKPDGDATFTTQFVGTPKDFADGGKTPIDSPLVGKVFKTQQGTSVQYKLKGNELYVRAIINSSEDPKNPSFPNQKQQAWTQPVGWALQVVDENPRR